MARYTGASCRLCRREGQKLFLKGERCYSDKCAIVTRKGAVPASMARAAKKVSEYGIQLRAKQRPNASTAYLRTSSTTTMKWQREDPVWPVKNLLRFLESRLDNIVYRAGFANSRKEARQLVLHRHFTVNGKRVNIPSYLCKAGDVIAVADGFKNSEKLKSIVEINGARPVPMWIDKNNDQMVASIVRLPNREDIDLEVEEHLIVELYSK